MSAEAAPLPTAKAIAVAASAVALEGYDLTIYGLFAVTIAHAFFPARDATSSLLMAVGTLGVGYVVRPIGGVILGAYADRAGRKPAIALTVLLMSLSTGIIGLIPGESTIGLAAPILVVLARLAQGFAAGGAVSGTISYLAETAPPGRRGFYASWQQTSWIGAFLLSAGIGAVITNTLSPHQLAEWGWRIPFLLAFLFGPLGLYIKSHLPEPEAYIKAAKHFRSESVGRAILRNRNAVLIGFGLTCLWNITAFILLFYMPTYAQKDLALPAGDAFLSSALSGLLLFILCPLVGRLSDRVGRKAPMLLSALCLMLFTYPIYLLIDLERTFASLVLAQVILAVFIAGYTAPIPAMLAELYPTHNRSTGLSVAYNLSTLIVGAFGPFIVTWLIATTRSSLAPAFYVAIGALVSVGALVASRDHSLQALEE